MNDTPTYESLDGGMKEKDISPATALDATRSTAVSPLAGSDIGSEYGIGEPRDISSETPESELPPQQLLSHGFSATRFASDDELGLNIKQTSEVVAEIFRATKADSSGQSEFVFALYGEWGRGKTTLIKEAAKALQEDGYHHILFSAWKYPTRPEVWVHLYERVREAACQGSFLQRLSISFRLGVLDAGWAPLLIGLALILCSALLPADEKKGLLAWLWHGGALFCGAFFIRTASLGKLLARRYFKAPDHSDKLGLQAVIGHDLKNLLRVWVESPLDRESTTDKKQLSKIDFRWFRRGWWGAIGAGILCLSIASASSLKPWLVNADAAVSSHASRTTTLEHCLVREMLAEPAYSSTAGLRTVWGSTSQFFSYKKPPSFSWAFMLAVGLALIGAIAYLLVVTWPLRRPSMVLLTVDDLDRCEPAQMLAVVDSLRLFVDDEAISLRMQVAMLMDRNLLEKALLQRASESKMSPDTNDVWRFCQMQREKLFVCELEMPALDATDRDDILGRLFSNTPHRQSNTSPEGEKKTIDNRLRDDVPNTRDPRGAAYRDAEVNALRNTINKVPANLLTPRSIRMIKIRFELARLLLKKRQMNATPDLVADLILRRFVGSRKEAFKHGNEVERIVAHVTCDTLHQKG